MATTSKTKADNPNLTRSRSLGRKPKPVPSSEPGDESEKKTKPVPNYLKPTISSRPDPVKFLKKGSGLDDSQKLLRRRSFDHPSPSSMKGSSTVKSLNTSPARPRDRPAVPREKPVTGMRSTTVHGSSRGGLKGSSTVKGSSSVKAHPVASRGSPGVKKSGPSGGSSSKSKKEVSGNAPKKSSGKEKEITPETSPLAPAHEEEEETVKVETDVQVSDEKEEPKEEDRTEEQIEDQSKHGDAVSKEEEEKGELISEDKTEEQVEEPKEQETTQENKSEDHEEVEKKVDDEEKKVDDEEKSEPVVLEEKESASVEESKEEEEAEVKEEEGESSKVEEATTEPKAHVDEAVPEEGKKKEAVQGNKDSPKAYNDVIASKMQENPRKNKVLALAGAFQTVIDYETAASK